MNAPAARMAPDYRSDIDGLRALAVVAVILFHAHVPGFGGGFVGVDVFFVISGFLITQLLLVRSAQPVGAWLREFWLRRARRILPALLFMMTATTCAAVYLFTPAELRLYGQALWRSAAMLANVAAMRMGGYFDTPWAITPLQHLWSIAVEEQFYLVYPLALFLLLRLAAPRARLALLALATVGSFALCVWAATTHPHANYYVPMTRAWELLVGAMLALHGIRPVRHRVWRELLAVGGLLMIGAAVFAYDNSVPFPGWYALPPCLGAAALIAAGSTGGSSINRAFAWRPVAFVGLLSYSLYLWHAPVQVFWQYFFVAAPGFFDRATQFALIMVLAFASWKWLETPLRRRERMESNRVFLGVMTAWVAGLITLGLLLWNSTGLPGRFSDEEKRLMLATHLPDQSIIDCMARIGEQVAAGELCSFGVARAPRQVVVLWGDSHALTLLPALRDIAERRGEQLRFGALSSCRPLTGVLSTWGARSTQQRCLDFNLDMTHAIEKLQPDVVVLAAYWAFPNANPEPLPSLGGQPADPVFSRALEDVITRIRANGRRICVVRDVPTFRYDVAHALAMAHRRGVAADFNAMSRAEAVAQQRVFDEQFDVLEGRGLFRSVRLRDVMCASGECRMQDDSGTPLYSDTHHLTPEGARLVEPEVQRCFD